jgi:hypothetical protein
MPLQPDAENNPAHTGDDIPTKESDNSGISLPPVIAPPDPPQPPSPPHQPTNNPQRWWQDRKYVLELCGFIVLFLYTIFAGLQWWHIRWANTMTREALSGNNSALQQTLDRMVWQIKEAHEIAKQTLAQSTQTTKIANDTHDLAIAAGKQADAAKSLANLTAKQVTANQELIESQRASISVSFGRVINPITFHDGAPSIVFSILLQNTGAIKATHVAVRLKPYYSLWGNNIFNEPLQKQRDFCATTIPPDQDWGWENGKRIDLKGLRDWTVTIEPHTAFEHQLNFGMGKPTDAEIIKWPPADAIQTNPTLTVTDRVFPIVVGCVDYQSGAMPEKHQTGFIFEVQEGYSDASTSNAAPILVHYGIDLSPEKVVITQFFFGQGKQY